MVDPDGSTAVRDIYIKQTLYGDGTTGGGVGWGDIGYNLLIDANGPIPGLAGKYFADKMPRFFRGPQRPRLGDLAYTEVAMFDM